MISKTGILALLGIMVAFVGCDVAPEPREVQEVAVDDPYLERARRVLAETPLIDGHNDLPWVIRQRADSDVAAYDLRQTTPGHTDIPRLRQGMVGAQYWAAYVPCDYVDEGGARVMLEQVDIIRQMIDRYPDHFELALTAADIERIFEAGRIASIISLEGGHGLENSLGTLRAYYDLGARYLTLTHNCNLDWVDAANEPPQANGLTEFGKEVVREMNWLGMLVDLSHVSPAVMHDALDVSEAPVIFSHSSARALTDHVRNVPDDVLRRIPQNRGLVMVTFVPSFISEEVRTHTGPGPTPRATLSQVADHIEHIRDVAGIEYVGIGGDFDGITTVIEGLEDASTYPDLFAELARRGWSDEDLRKLAGENALRVIREAEQVATRLRLERGPSTATIEELDGEAP